MELVIEDLSKSFGEKQVLQNISFTFSSGKIYGLLGRNGAGKTTFFNCVNEDVANRLTLTLPGSFNGQNSTS